jgi:hypothetical protein
MEEKLMKLIGKKVHVTFQSRRFNNIYNLTGTLTGVDSQWAYFVNPTSDYPEGAFDYVNILRIRSVDEA